MNSFFYISLLGITLLVPASKSDSSELFEDFIKETHEVCSVNGSMRVAIATCKVDNVHLSFEDKVRLCTIKMRPVVMPRLVR